MKTILVIAGLIGLTIIWSALDGSKEAEPSGSALECHPNYSGCLDPDASDYDCVGGSGNGPRYTGRVRVMGPDVFDLDRDGDGIGCE